ncbi:hypothetical protein IHE44_0004675 [Lamprotornis superbus]|uniref:FFD box profile domain-containing protein n=1 Tax=Lamprotornis superbus TaxID=245042 RepID=A0A835NYX8_9PASS|nr:hypothetical protein IHE44_0004675 [Lamprotornis superbus]
MVKAWDQPTERLPGQLWALFVHVEVDGLSTVLSKLAVRSCRSPWIPLVHLAVSLRSFGTEDRPTDRPAPPREEIYEYIIFRGSDIKDITVCEPPKAQHTLPQDPAIVQSSLGSASTSSFQPHVPYSPFRGMPPYSQLAASSLLSQQYAASLGLVRKSPMVEQAVQTGPVDSMNSQKLPPVKVTPGIPRSARQVPQANSKASDTVQAAPVQTQGQVNDENRRPQRRRSDDKAETGEEKGDPGVATQNNDGNAEEDLLGPNCYYDKSKSFFDNISSELKSSAKCEIKGWKLRQINKDSIRDRLKGREANNSLTFSGCSRLMTASSMFFPPDCTTWVKQREALGAWPGVHSNKPLSEVNLDTVKSHRRDVKQPHLKKSLDDKFNSQIIRFNGLISLGTTGSWEPAIYF